MVSLFFVISGYALSLKPLRHIRARSPAQLSATLSSFIFRRGIRLFLPPAISTLMIVVLLRAGLYEWTRSFAADPTYMRNVQEIHYVRLNSTGEQLADWAHEMFDFVHVWDWDAFAGSTAMDVHLWTIPVEFRASMMVFLTLLGTAGLKAWCRVGVMVGMAAFAFASVRWEMVLFYAGAIMAELDLARADNTMANRLPTSTSTVPPSSSRTDSPGRRDRPASTAADDDDDDNETPMSEKPPPHLPIPIPIPNNNTNTATKPSSTPSSPSYPSTSSPNPTRPPPPRPAGSPCPPSSRPGGPSTSTTATTSPSAPSSSSTPSAAPAPRASGSAASSTPAPPSTSAASASPSTSCTGPSCTRSGTRSSAAPGR